MNQTWTELDYEMGNEFMKSLFDAQVSYNLGGLGGCPSFNIEDFPESHREQILEYLYGDHQGDSVRALLNFIRC